MSPSERLIAIRELIAKHVKLAVLHAPQEPGVVEILKASKPLIESATSIRLHGVKTHMSSRPCRAELEINDESISRSTLLLHFYINRKALIAFQKELDRLVKDIVIDVHGTPVRFVDVAKGSLSNYVYGIQYVERRYATDVFRHPYSDKEAPEPFVPKVDGYVTETVPE